MSSLRERVEGLVADLKSPLKALEHAFVSERGDNFNWSKHYAMILTCCSVVNDLAAALAAEEQEDKSLHGTFIVADLPAAAPSLHKEGAGGDDVQVRLDRIAANVERVVHGSYARDAVRKDALEEAAQIADGLLYIGKSSPGEGVQFTYLEDVAKEIRGLAASPAGRAEQDVKGFAGDPRDSK